jgi:outer membrane protein OmpA-like peptidoglycan-associated protein
MSRSLLPWPRAASAAGRAWPRSLALAVAVAIGGAGCSLFTVKQDPMPVMEIRADRPPPGPDRVVLTPSAIQINDKVQFATGKAEILPSSFGLLDDVAKVFVDNPQIEVVQVEGHTDSTGTAAINRSLSQQRAESVVRYLASKGVARKRMIAKGFGPDRPIASNDEEAGREQNRRVELNIVKQGPKKTIVKDE